MLLSKNSTAANSRAACSGLLVIPKTLAKPARLSVITDLLLFSMDSFMLSSNKALAL
jgi:hypothetical protein